jgi:hypothetical protein
MADEKDQVAAAKKRVARIRRSLTSKGWKDVAIQPVIVTPLSQADTADHRADAEGRGVLVLCREDLEESLRRAATAPDADGYLNEKLIQLRNANLFRDR